MIGTVVDEVLIPGGDFLQGSPDSMLDLLERADQPFPRRWFADETPQVARRVQPYRIDRCPVTVGQFGEFVRETGHRTDAEELGYGLVYGGEGWAEQPDRGGRSTATSTIRSCTCRTAT
jgi:sulfatase modifying factor 1